MNATRGGYVGGTCQKTCLVWEMLNFFFFLRTFDDMQCCLCGMYFAILLAADAGNPMDSGMPVYFFKP